MPAIIAAGKVAAAFAGARKSNADATLALRRAYQKAENVGEGAQGSEPGAQPAGCASEGKRVRPETAARERMKVK